MLRAELRHRRIVEWAGNAEFATPDELAAAIAALAMETPLLRRAARADVEVTPPLVQVRTLTDLPPVHPGALAALVALQAGRYFRKNGKPLVTDATWIGPRNRWQRGPYVPRAARAAAIEAPWVDAIVAGTLTAGLPIPTIFAGDAPGARRLDLIAPAERVARRRRALGLTRRMAVLAAALWMSASALYVGRLVGARGRLGVEAARVRKASDAVSAARRALDDGQAMVATVSADAAVRGELLARLGALLSALPDSAFLSSLELDRDGHGVITGGAPHAAEVVAALERRSVVAGARLDGSPNPEIVGGTRRERFTIRFGREVAR